MLRLAIFSVFILVFFGNCHKESTDLKVTYKIRETSNDIPSYNISYTSDKSGNTSNISSSLDVWDSSTLLLKKGQFISLTLDCSAPNYDFTLDIIVDGGIWKEAQLDSPNSSITVSGTIGN
jgi:hypothetical protein